MLVRMACESTGQRHTLLAGQQGGLGGDARTNNLPLHCVPLPHLRHKTLGKHANQL